MNRKQVVVASAALFATLCTFAVLQAATGRQAVQAPRFTVNPLWPKPLPKASPPLPTFHPRRIKFECKPS